MAEPYIAWALLVGMGIGGALVWFVLGRLPRQSDDVGPEERLLEAGWISDVLASRGGAVPEDVVDQVLELHQAYVAGPPIELNAEDRDVLRAERARRRASAAEGMAAAEAAEATEATETRR